jgi:aryl-alcohol dehydrogenase-like predicted oxidoreductase
LAYSPLAFGLLTGKYLEGIPENTRLALFQGFGQRYEKTNLNEAVKSYVDLARQYNLTPAQMALAWVRTCWFVSSTIIGATNLEQLKENLSSIDIELDREIIAAIDQINAKYPNPTP